MDTDGKPRVLVIDDNPMNREAFMAILDREYAVTTASSGRRAIDLAATEDFDVILLDVRMVGMDGFETAEHLRTLERNRHTPIIFISVHNETMVPMMKCGYIPGATDFVFGLVDEDLLRLKVSTYVQMRRREAAMKTYARQLGALIQSLHADAAAITSPAFTEKVRMVEGVLENLQRHLFGAGSPPE